MKYLVHEALGTLIEYYSRMKVDDINQHLLPQDHFHFRH